MNALRRPLKTLATRLKKARAAPLPPLPGQHLLALLADPPGQAPVFAAYNRLRQHYIVAATMRHFGARADDPAHLFEKNLLDVGCGAATIAEFLALAGAEITAIDPNPAALAKARASAEAFGAPVEFIQTTAEKLLPTGQKFDVVLALDLLEVVPDPAKSLWVLKQLVAPGGVLIVGIINRSVWAWVLHVLFSTYLYGRVGRAVRGWHKFFTPPQLAQLLKPLGLHMQDVQWLRFSSTRRRWIYAEKHSKRATRYLACVVVK